jgi:hypothetical protein
MNTTGKLADMGSESFDEVSDAVVSFVLDTGEIFGCLFHHLVDAHYRPDEDKLVLRWPVGAVEITGPKALEFYRAFAKGRGSWCRADGTDITSVTFIAAPKRA